MHIALTAVWGKRHGIFVEPTNESCGSDWKDWLLQSISAGTPGP